MLYTGDVNDTCVISFLPVTELERPVGFDGRHAFECESVVHWLTQYRGTHPVTGLVIQPHQLISSVLHPLIVNGRIDHLAGTRHRLECAGSVINSEARPVVSSSSHPSIFDVLTHFAGAGFVED